MCWDFLTNKTTLALRELEDAEIEMAKWKTKLNQLNRRKELIQNDCQ